MPAGATYEPIATTTLGSAAASITFSSIPATYTDLRLVVVGTPATATAIWYRFNNDTAANFSNTAIQGNGTTAASNNATNNNYIRLNGSGNPSSTTIPSLWTIDVFSYAGSTFKTSLGTCSTDQNGSGAAVYTVGLWQSTTAINRLDIFPASSINWNSGTTATLYGIKAA